jgi:tetratricopeptide (TPR) repeat protein
MQLERWEESENALNQALRLHPKSFLVEVIMGMLWFNRTDKDRIESLQIAKDRFLSAIQIKRDAPALTLLGSAYAQLDDTTAAREAFEEAIEIYPNYDEALYNLAVIEEKTNPQKARELLERAIQIDPEYALAHHMLGRVFTRLKDLDRAEFHYRMCLKINPDEYWNLLYLAGLLVARKQNTEAEELYLHAIELSPEMAGAYEFYARFLEKNGRVTEAAKMRAKIKPSERAREM